jgi:peptide/nickel transport system substrate-binding protein
VAFFIFIIFALNMRYDLNARAMKVLKALSVVLLSVITAITSVSVNALPEVNHEIVFAIGQKPINLDPRYAKDAASERLNRLLYQSLVDFDAQSKVKPSLASWNQINTTTYQFSLNKSREAFHNQQVLNATDVKATYDSLIDLKDSPHAAEFLNIQAIEVVDNDTVLFKLSKPDQHFPEKLLIGILPKELIEKKHDFAHYPVGSGPLKLLSWQNKLILERLSDGQRISLIEVKDPTVRVLKLLHGEADLIQGELPPELVKYLQSKSNITLSTSVGANFSYLGLNFNDAALSQLKVRQAISYAINRAEIVEKVMIEHSRVADQILPPEHYAGNAELMPVEYNPNKARQLLVEAGVKLPLKLVFKTSTDAQRVRFATIMQAQMAKAGIDLQISSLDFGTFFSDVNAGQFQLYGLTWVGIKTPEIYAKVFGSQSFPPAGVNRGRYADATLDQLLADEDWPAATERIHTQLPYIPLWYEGQFAAMRKNIIGYSAKMDGNWDDLAIISHRQ